MRPCVAAPQYFLKVILEGEFGVYWSTVILTLPFFDGRGGDSYLRSGFWRVGWQKFKFCLENQGGVVGRVVLKDFWKSFSSHSCTRERSLPFTYGRPDESCSSFTLMYFGKCRASRIDLFCSSWILLMIVSDVVMVASEPYSKIGRTHCL